MSHSSSSSDTDPLDTRGDEGWEDAEPDVEEIQVVSLFDSEVFPDLKAMIEDCKKRHNFDFIAIQKKLGVYSFSRFNFARLFSALLPRRLCFFEITCFWNIQKLISTIPSQSPPYFMFCLVLCLGIQGF